MNKLDIRNNYVKSLRDRRPAPRPAACDDARFKREHGSLYGGAEQTQYRICLGCGRVPERLRRR